MDARSLDKDRDSIIDVVSAEKADAINTGTVKDDEAQRLSVLAEKESALGARSSDGPAGKTKGSAKRAQAKAQKASGAASPETICGEPAEQAIDAKPMRQMRVRQALARRVVSELDDAEEFEGTQGLYDSAYAARRGISRLRARKSKTASSKNMKAAGDSAKSAGAAGAKKGATASTAGATPRAASAQLSAQAACKAASAGSATGTTTMVAGAAGGTGAVAVGGVLSAIIAFILICLMVGQIASALFGFWDAEDKKRSLEGLPPYITYEMVEEAISCQEEYGHPAGCTIAQIICESGQGDSMSALATRDHNLFGMKWSASFASAPEVAGKAGWSTSEEYTPGEITHITAYFIRFKGDVECIRFRSRVFLQASHYRNNALIKEAIAEHSSDKMAEGLKDAGWATSSTYVDTLKSILDTYNLRRFDGMSLDDFKSGAFSSDAIVSAAHSQLGVPYVWGGTTPGVGLDCSGLTQYCYAQAGIRIPRNSEDQAAFGRKVPLAEAMPGDILWRPGHVAIYIGGNSYIHEPHTGAVCTIADGISYFTCAVKIR